MVFVYIDRINDLTIVHRDVYGKRSIIIQAAESQSENGIDFLFSSCQLHAPSQNVVSFEMLANAFLVIDHGSKCIKLEQDKIIPSLLRFRKGPVLRGPIN